MAGVIRYKWLSTEKPRVIATEWRLSKILPSGYHPVAQRGKAQMP